MTEDNFKAHEIRDRIHIDYKYTYGSQSKFFIDLMNEKKLQGTKCKKCGKVWMPPRVGCSDCFEDTDWIELPHTGEIMVSTIVWYTTSDFIQKIPYGIAFIKLDNADTGMLQGVFSENLVPSKIRKGQKVRAVFKTKEKREGKMTDFFFVPEEEYQTWINQPEYEGGE
ncbi:MAG: Zn-ribbon domain-containing OB-fold protein [Promethearchaeota archaeon]|nr:MAG: Zn-ribbon domain-containing OB-fold protein [Candidatus Lokiarchaeota archaeon]